MNRLILITGDLASGKSTLANGLSSKLHIPFYSKDKMKEILADTVGFETRNENRTLSIATVNEMSYCFEQNAKVGADLILEANFRSMELAEFRRLSLEYNYQVCLIVLTGDKSLLYQRFCERVPSRHRAHLSLGLNESLEKFSEYIDMLRKEDLIFPARCIDITNLSPIKVIEVVMGELNKEKML